MTCHVDLQFPGPDQVIVSLEDETTAALEFVNPMTAKDRKDVQWYIEVYGALSLADPDEKEAQRVAAKLPEWGKALFEAVFSDRAAARLFNRFQDSKDRARLVTISAEHPAVLALPWELLHDPAPGGTFLFYETPRISIRRRVSGATGGREPFQVRPKDRLHLLFVVSRPAGSTFLDPRADPQAVLDALDQHAPGQVTWEFLRPPTLDALVERLEQKNRTPVDVLHFDGHGVFDRQGSPPLAPPNTGYLLFEKDEQDERGDNLPDFVSAQRLGENLHRHEVALVILSACQTAALGENDEPMGSVAARLTATGIPAVLAMTHSVLAATTRALFGAFYKDLARGCGIGESLDNARRYLANHPQKYEVQRYDPQRGPYRKWLELQDWFLPALYQSGDDPPLLRHSEGGVPEPAVAPVLSNVPARPEAGFFGRRRELWDIERWFAAKARRITLTGFGGQGKTELAREAGRWLTRIGMFRAAAFVDYSRVQSRDALAVAISTLGTVLGESLPDAQAAAEALKKTPTLVILDNLEALVPESLAELLDAAAAWSDSGLTRVLSTTRKPDFNHPAYRVEGTHLHRRIVLAGLGRRSAPDDALAWFAELTKLPPPPTVKQTPKREALIELFDRVKFHPLSIRVLAAQLKTRDPKELGQRLGQLLAAANASTPTSVATEATLPELVASLNLSLDQLDESARQVLPRLGVFHGGAMEDNVLAITEIGEDAWPALRRQLEAAAVVEAETLPGVTVPFLRFHPTLAPMLWGQLSAADQARLSAAHRQRYYALANYLYQADDRTPHEARAIALRELPNLLVAVHAALDAGDPDAGEFAECVNRFLDIFGLRQESEAVVAKAQAAAGEAGSRAWYLAQSSRGEQLLAAGRVSEAAEVFRAVLENLGAAPSHERAVTLARLGRCFRAGGRPDLAAQHARDAIADLEQLQQTDQVKRHRGVCLTDLADALVDQGQYADARKAHEDGLAVVRGLGDVGSQGAVLAQLGRLAMLEGNLAEALDRYRGALTLFQQLREPAMEAVAWHQVALVFEEARQWDEAERHYRESARIKEQQGDLAGAAQTWNQLARVAASAGRPEAAEMWYRKAIEGGRKEGDMLPVSRALGNLAILLLNLPGRLAEARQVAEEALAIHKTLDPGAAEIWKTYGLLAEIAENEAEIASEGGLKAQRQAEARQYRRLARDAKRNFPGTRHELRRRAPLILATVLATQDRKHRDDLEQVLPELERHGWTKLVAAIRRVLAGERDPDVLCESLDLEDSMIVETILQALSDPSTLTDLLADQDQA